MPPFEIQIDEQELPAPGEDVLVTSGPYEILIGHTGDPQTEVDQTAEEPGSQITFSVVDVHGATRVHAAAVRQREVRSRVDRHPLCSRSQTRKVARRRRDIDLSAVNCTQCRSRLVAEGVL
ncbi:hypothetical protein ACIGG9_26000 [Pseudonocardia alni]|uniref:hypothetical protein n=1 Tax=Pseudonocardia alni TaxID=33907 RepID=UPI00340895B2